MKIRFSLGKPASQSTVPAPPPASCALPTTWLPGRPAEEEEGEEEEEEEEEEKEEEEQKAHGDQQSDWEWACRSTP